MTTLHLINMLLQIGIRVFSSMQKYLVREYCVYSQISLRVTSNPEQNVLPSEKTREYSE